MDDNHYRTLNVPPEATPDDIQRAYRALARRFHPDLNSMPGALTRMTSINMAYEVLGVPAKRAAYDQNRKPHNQFIDEAILRAAGETLVRQGWAVLGENANDFVLRSAGRIVRILLMPALDSRVLQRSLARNEGFCVILAVRIESPLQVPSSVMVIDLMHSRLFTGSFPDPVYAQLFEKFVSIS
jgi:curved DNA-binding protein CbpA